MNAQMLDLSSYVLQGGKKQSFFHYTFKYLPWLMCGFMNSSIVELVMQFYSRPAEGACLAAVSVWYSCCSIT